MMFVVGKLKNMPQVTATKLFTSCDISLVGLFTRSFRQDWYSNSIRTLFHAGLCCQLCGNLVTTGL